jgi:predicted component of type VI protein secretion system
MKKTKLLALSATMLTGATLLQGCVGAFWEGLWKTGFSFGQSKWVDLTLDILREDLFS